MSKYHTSGDFVPPEEPVFKHLLAHHYLYVHIPFKDFIIYRATHDHVINFSEGIKATTNTNIKNKE